MFRQLATTSETANLVFCLPTCQELFVFSINSINLGAAILLGVLIFLRKRISKRMFWILLGALVFTFITNSFYYTECVVGCLLRECGECGPSGVKMDANVLPPELFYPFGGWVVDVVQSIEKKTVEVFYSLV